MTQLSPSRAVEQAKLLHEQHLIERRRLDEVRRYWRGRQKLPMVIPVASPREVKVMAASSRVNVLPIVVNSLVQSTFVDGFRAPGSDAPKRDQDSADALIWRAWQRNKMDARQSGVHRAVAGYGTSYSVVLPGDPVPVIRGVSPRSMHAVYGEDPDWPIWALERTPGGKLWRLYDDDHTYYLQGGSDGKWEHIETRHHDTGVTPVIRFVDEEDLDADDEVESQVLTHPGSEAMIARGQVAPLAPLQDQVDLTTFGLQIAQHYGAFKQRYIIGWASESEAEAVKVAASRLVTLDVEPDTVKVGEWAQTDIKGYIDSRESTLQHAASLSQTPIHELTGQLVNLSAEALAAAEAGKDRKVDERQTLWGESHEQELSLVGQHLGVDVPDDAQVIWRDTSARAFAATVDGLGKLATMLGVPPQMLWERIPGVSQQDVQRWETAAESGDAFARLNELLEKQVADDGAVPGSAPPS